MNAGRGGDWSVRSEKRKSERVEVSEQGTVSWRTSNGDTFGERVLLLNLSDNGVLIEMSHQLESRQTVQLKIPSQRIDGSASVRYCKQKGQKYRIGLELFYPIEAKPKAQRWT